MEKQLRLPIQFLRDNNKDFASLKIFFSESAVEDLCLGLVLLKENLVLNLIIKDEEDKFTLTIESLPEKHHAKLVWHDPGANLSLAANEIEYCCMFFLRIFRDGKSEINHVDIEYTSINSSEIGYVTFVAPSSLFRPAQWT